MYNVLYDVDIMYIERLLFYTILPYLSRYNVLTVYKHDLFWLLLDLLICSILNTVLRVQSHNIVL